ncbi:hypothetical protein G6045_05815 [Streptomyces sp. YC504]|uniref:Uncharacterized protein n=1 Tax=Streptomyces mesophilus TaxID=1775132 RepID=A0A6G4XDF7_9ACTN|nr:hypothetical protein [Streptomyces mesophilus]NGO75202.1 hypothetical protein [Streptomyces mesophilus]
MPLSSTESTWTEPAAIADTGCTEEELQEFGRLALRSTSNGRDFRASRFEVGGWLNAKFGPPSRSGARNPHAEEHLTALAEHQKLSLRTLHRCRMVEHRWAPELRQQVFDSCVYVSFSVMLLVAQGEGASAVFDPAVFAHKSTVLLRVMKELEQAGVLEATESDFLKALRADPLPGRTLETPRQSKAVTQVVHQFASHQPEARAAVLDAVRSDTEAKRSIAASYLLERPALARAVLREEPELAELAAQQAAVQHRDGSESTSEAEQATFHEFVQVLGGAKPSDDLLLAEWREDFATALGRFSKFVSSWYPAESVVDKADDELLTLIAYLAQDVTAWAQNISDARKPGLRLVGKQAQ